MEHWPHGHGMPLPPPPPLLLPPLLLPLPPLPPPPPPCYRFRPIDRHKTCPFLLRTFVKLGSYHSLLDFMEGKVPPKEEEYHVYTWKDATLRELTEIVKTVVPAATRRDAKLSFTLVFPDNNGNIKSVEMGKAFSHEQGKLHDHRVLGNYSFDIGDHLDVYVFVLICKCPEVEGFVVID